MKARDEMVREMATRGGAALQRFERFMKMGMCTPDMAMSDQASESSLLVALNGILMTLEENLAELNVTVR